HPAQDLAAFVCRERLRERGALQTSVACFDDLVYRRGVSTQGSNSGSGLVARGQIPDVESTTELVGEREPEGVNRGTVERRAAGDRFDRSGDWNNREGIPLDHERSKLPRK